MSNTQAIETIMNFQNQLILGMASSGMVDEVELREALIMAVQSLSAE